MNQDKFAEKIMHLSAKTKKEVNNGKEGNHKIPRSFPNIILNNVAISYHISQV